MLKVMDGPLRPVLLTTSLSQALAEPSSAKLSVCPRHLGLNTLTPMVPLLPGPCLNGQLLWHQVALWRMTAFVPAGVVFPWASEPETAAPSSRILWSLC